FDRSGDLSVDHEYVKQTADDGDGYEEADQERHGSVRKKGPEIVGPQERILDDAGHIGWLDTTPVSHPATHTHHPVTEARIPAADGILGARAPEERRVVARDGLPEVPADSF